MEERRKTREKKKGGDRRRRTFTRDEKGVESGAEREREREIGGRAIESAERRGSKKERSPLVGRASRFLDFRVFSNSRSENSGAGRFWGEERVNAGGSEIEEEEEIEYPSCANPFNLSRV